MTYMTFHRTQKGLLTGWVYYDNVGYEIIPMLENSGTQMMLHLDITPERLYWFPGAIVKNDNKLLWRPKVQNWLYWLEIKALAELHSLWRCCGGGGGVSVSWLFPLVVVGMWHKTIDIFASFSNIACFPWLVTASLQSLPLSCDGAGVQIWEYADYDLLNA